MNFLWPYALAALIGVPAAVLIALWRARRREVPVASLLLWQSLARKLADSGRKRRTVLDLPLVLAAVSALLLGIAAAGPVLSHAGIRGRTVLLVLDRSASMKMNQNGTARWDLARREAHRLLDELSAQDRVYVAAGPQADPVRVGPLGPAEAGKLLDTLQPTDRPANLADDLSRALAAAEAIRPFSAVVFTDDPAAAPPEAIGGAGAIAVVSVGGPADNVFFTRFGFSATAAVAGDDACRILLGVKNSGGPRDVTLCLAADDGGARTGAPAARSVHLDAGAEHTEIFEGDFAAARFLAAKIEADDSLAADNLLYAVRPPERHVRVLLQGNDNPFIEAALKVFPSVEIVHGAASAGQAAAAAGLAEFDIVICNGVSPGAISFPGPVVVIDPTETFGPIAVGPPVDDPKITTLASGSILDDTGLADARIRSARRITVAATAAGARVLAASDRGPMVVENANVICLGFSLDRSNTDWMLKPGFPVFWAKVMERLSPDGRRGFVSYPTGQDAAVPPADGARTAVRVLPERGEQFELPAQEESFRTELAGLYELSSHGQPQSLLAFNLLDSAESSTKGSTGLFTREMIKEHVPDVGSGRAAGRSSWLLMNLVLAAGVVSLLAHWYLKQ